MEFVELRDLDVGVWTTRTTAVIEGTEVTVSFGEDGLGGLSGCNSYGGPARLRLVLDGGPHPFLVEALLGGDLDEPLAQRRRVRQAGRSPGLGGSALGPGGAAAVPGRLPGSRPAASGFLRRLVAVEAVAELDAEAPERPLHAVRHRALDGGLVTVCVVLGHGVEPDVGAGRRAPRR